MSTDFDSFEEFVRTQRAAGNTDLSPSELVSRWRQAIRDANGSSPAASFADRLRQAGLLGCFEGGPDDLSSNPKHMEGFGESR